MFVNDAEKGELLVSIAKEQGYGGKNYTDERIWKDILLKGEGMLRAIQLAQGRAILTPSEKEKAELLALLIKEHPLVKLLYDGEHSLQKPHYFDLEDFPCKCLPDMLCKRAAGRRVVDFKFTTLDPEQAMQQFRYDIQMAFYQKGLQTLYPGETFLSPVLIFATDKGQVHIFEMSELDLQVGEHGTHTYLLEKADGTQEAYMRKYPVKGFKHGFAVLKGETTDNKLTVKKTRIW
jgi:hypothetical protein